jgi:hypothetical protein
MITSGFLKDKLITAVCLLAVAALAMAVTAACGGSLVQGDTFWHLKAGEWVLSYKEIPKADPFSWTAPGAPWHAHEWLWEILAAVSWRICGVRGLWVLTAAGVALAAAFSFLLAARRSGGPAWALACAPVSIASLAAFISARPHVLALSFLTAWLWLLDLAREKRWAAACLPVLAVVWANVHASAPLGPLMGIVMLSADALAKKRGVVARQFAGAAVSFLATGMNPWGFGVWWFALKVGSHPEMVNTINEWLSPDFHSPFMLPVLAAALPLLLPRGDAAFRILAAGAFLAGLVSMRHLAVFAVLWPAAAAPALAARFSGPDGKTVAATALVLAALGLTATVSSPPPAWPGSGFPEAAVSYMEREGLTDRVFNYYTWGGYLIWRGVEPFVDGRADMYVLSGSGVMDDYDRAEGILRPPEPDAVFAKWGVKTVLMPADSWMALYLSRNPGWWEVYRDDMAAVYARAVWPGSKGD